MNLERIGAHRPRKVEDPVWIPSAVLIPIVPRSDGYTLLLGKRSDRLASHQGQICFPGGRLDPTDADLVACALREAHEEAGIFHEEVTCLGQLDELVTSSGYRISPIVGLLNQERVFQPASSELVSLHEIPLARLLGRRAWRQETIAQGPSMRLTQQVFDIDGHVVWGATARMTRQLLGLLQA